MVRGKSTLGRESGAFPPVRPLACLLKHISSVYWQARTFPILLFRTVIGKIWGKSLSIEGEVYPHPPPSSRLNPNSTYTYELSSSLQSLNGCLSESNASGSGADRPTTYQMKVA